MVTARDICKSILRKLHVLGQGQSVSNDELNDVLSNVNNMLSVWSVEGNLVYTETSETFNLVTGQASYSIGTSQDFNTSRILDITSAYVTNSATDYILSSYDQAQYAAITNKTIGGIPEIYYFDGDYPVSNIKLYPVPSGVSTITLNTQKQLTGFADLDTVYALPEEYGAGIIFNGCIWVGPDYEKEPTPSVMKLANRTKKAIETQNRRNNRAVSTLGVPQSEEQSNNYDIFRGF